MIDRIPEEFTSASTKQHNTIKVGWGYWWLHFLLLGLTFLSTTIFGFALEQAFSAGRTLTEADWAVAFSEFFSGHLIVWRGISYSLPLLSILLAHELGHYFLCRRWGVAATLPFFGPSPSLLGTVGAFIWIRSPIYRRRALFDIGIYGPVCGFVVVLPFLLVGLWKSRLCAGLPQIHDFSFGTPALVRFVETLRFPGLTPIHICLHPMAMAAWAGLLATAINLLPVGQLDGGHIVYAVLGERGHRFASWATIILLALGGFLYWPWWAWAGVMFFFRRHPLIHDSEAIGNKRMILAALAVLLLLLSFSVIPVRAS